MQHTESYGMIIDHEGEANDMKQAKLESLADEIRTAVVNENEYQGWTFADVLGYLTPEGVTAWEEWTRQGLVNGIQPVTQAAFDSELDKAIMTIAILLDKEAA